jgi:hypothetical protein
MGCGGKRSATPLLCGRRFLNARGPRVRAKAPSPLRFAGAVQDAYGFAGRVVVARSTVAPGAFLPAGLTALRIIGAKKLLQFGRVR